MCTHVYACVHMFTPGTGAILKNPTLPEVTDSQVENTLKVWLRQSGERNGGRKERELKAAMKEKAGSSSSRQSHQLNTR